MNKTQEINAKLYEKLEGEYNKFIDELKALPPDEMVEKCYEKVMKEDLLLLFNDDDLPYKEAKALYSLEKPLDSLYSTWLNSDDSYLDMLRDSTDTCIQNAVKFMESKNKNVER